MHNVICDADEDRELKEFVMTLDSIADFDIEVIAWRYMIMMTVIYTHSSNSTTWPMAYELLKQFVPESVQINVFGRELTKSVLAKFLGLTSRRISYDGSEDSVAKLSQLKEFDELATIARGRRENLSNS